MIDRRNALRVLAATALAGMLPPAMAQDYPSRPVKMLVGFSAGGGVDAIARTLAARLGEQMGQNFVVDNRPGATSTIAANVLVSSPPDGYTVLLADSSLLIASRAMQNLSFDPLESFVPVAGVAIAPLAIAVAADSKLKSLEDMAAAAKAGDASVEAADARLHRRMAAGLRRVAAPVLPRAFRHAADHRRAPGKRTGQGFERPEGGAGPLHARLHHDLPPRHRAAWRNGRGTGPLDRTDQEIRDRAEVDRLGAPSSLRAAVESRWQPATGLVALVDGVHVLPTSSR